MLPLQEASGIAVTAPGRTFVDLAPRFALVELASVGDAMVRRGFTTTSDLRATVAAAAGARGVPVARRAAGLVRAGVDSPMETRVRLLVVLGGLPIPEPGGEILDDDGQWIATGDLLYRAQRMLIEYDGDLHRTSSRKWRHGLRTRELLRDLGWEVVVLTADDILRHPQHTLLRIHRLLRARGHPDVPDRLAPACREALSATSLPWASWPASLS